MKPLTLLFAMVLVGSLAYASPPSQMSYQGVLRNSDGTPVPDNTYQLTFRIYDVESGGTAMWTEVQSVPVIGGIFNAFLGSVQTLALAFDEPYWLGVTVGTNPELVPRIQLGSAPYAMRAVVADSAVTGGADSDWSIAGSNIYRMSGNIGIGTSTPGSKIDVKTPAYEARLASPTYGVWGNNLISQSYGGLGGTNVGGYGHSTNGKGLHGSTTDGYGVYGAAGGTGYSGYFEGKVRVGEFEMPAGAAAGHILISDATGMGSWQPASLASDGDWIVSGSNLYPGFPGNVGLGTTNPLKKLHVEESASAALAYPLKLDNPGSGAKTATGIIFKVDGGAEDRGKGGLVYERTATWNRGDFHILQNSAASMTAAGLTNAVVTIKNDGKVGIGTKTPSAKLDVSNLARVQGDTWPATGEGLELAYSSSLNRGYVQAYDRGGSTWGDLYLGGGGVGVGGGSLPTTARLTAADGARKAHLAGSDYGVKAEGDLVVTGAYRGDLGPNNGAPFPRPAYDSGWIAIDPCGYYDLSHNIGVDVNKYVVDLTSKNLSGGSEYINNRGTGGDARGACCPYSYAGIYWTNLTTTSIRVWRECDNTHGDLWRVRIWMYN